MKRKTIPAILVVIATLALFGVSSHAQRPARLPDMTFKRLLNGLQVIIAETPMADDGLTIGLVLRYGSAFDPADKGGLANLTSRLLMKATLDKTAKSIQDELTSIGATAEVRCDWDGYRFLLHGKSARFERSLLILYQIVAEAQFPLDEFTAAKQDMITRLGSVEDPRQQLRLQFERTLFSGTTYGRSLQGSVPTVQNISLGDVKLFYNKYFSPSEASLVVVGSFSVPAMEQKVSRIWGVWVQKDDVPFTFAPPRKPASRRMFLQEDADSPAAQFVIGSMWPRREDPAYYPATLGARILQDRLNTALPTSLLTVTAEGRRLLGPFYIQGQAAADQAGPQFKKIFATIDELKEAPVSAEELNQAKQRWIQEFTTQLTTPDGMCENLLDSELYRLGTNYLATFPDLIRRVDGTAVQEAATDWFFPGASMVMVLRGPGAALKPALEPLGALQPVVP